MLCLLSLLVANIMYLTHSILGFAATLSFFLSVPGYSFLSLLKHEMKSKWEIASFSLGLSLLLLMLGGLALNTLNLIGLKQPLTTLNIFLILDLMTAILIFLNRKVIIKLPKINFSFDKEKTIFTTILSFLPFLAAGGAISLNNGGTNILTIISFILIPTFVMLLIWRKKIDGLYPYAIFTMSLSVLLSTSLRGWSLTGHDIHHEFYVFQSTSNNSLWSTRTFFSDPYNACLSITILPTILEKITSISAMYIYKIIFQIIFAFGLIPIYLFIKKLSANAIALIGTFMFISFPPFLNDMPFLNRQEIAFIFFGLLMLTAFMKMSQKPKTILTIIFLTGIILSHYSTNYATLSILILAWIIYKLLTLKLLVKPTFALPILNIKIILLAIIITFLWNSQITKTTSGFQHTLINTFNGIIHHNLNQSYGVSYALFSAKPKDPRQVLAGYAGVNASKVQYIPEHNLPVTDIGKIVSHVISVESFNKFIRAVSAKGLQVLLLCGAIVFLVKLRRRRTMQEIYFCALIIASVILLALITLLPQLSVDYSVTRLFQQVLVIVALPIMIALELFLGFLGRHKIYVIAFFAAFLFLHLSGLIPQILGGYPPQLALNNSGTYYDIYYIHKSELAATLWLDQQNANKPLVTDQYARLRFPEYPFLKQHTIDPIFSKDISEYIYYDYTNTHRGIYADFLSGNVLEYSYSDQKENQNLLYSNIDNKIFGK